MSFSFFNHSCFRPRPRPQGVFPWLWRWGGKIQGKAPRFISLLIVEFNVQIFTVECTDIYKNTKKTSTGLRYSLFIQLSFNGHSPRRWPGVGHVVLTKFKIMYPDKFTPLAIQQHVIEAWWKVSSLLISGSGSWPQREALALSLFFFNLENTKNLPLALRARAREKIWARLAGRSRWKEAWPKSWMEKVLTLVKLNEQKHLI